MAAMAAMAAIPERVIASVVIVSAGLSMWALRQSNESNRLAEQSAVTARDSLALAERNETRLEKQDLQQIAIRVYLGEPSRQGYERHPTQERGQVWRVVINASGLQVENVWVADDNGRSVKIQGLQRCSMYALPPDFVPRHLYFTDPNGRWHRGYGGQIDTFWLPPPDSDTDDSPWFEPLQDCAS